MAEWHIADLRSALERRGWVITERPGDGHGVSATWELRRSNDGRTLWIDFDGLDDLRTLPLFESYGCALRGRPAGSLYFRRARRADLWKREVTAFVESLEPR